MWPAFFPGAYDLSFPVILPFILAGNGLILQIRPVRYGSGPATIKGRMQGFAPRTLPLIFYR